MGPTSLAWCDTDGGRVVARARAFDRCCDVVDAETGRSVWLGRVPEPPWGVAWAASLLAVAEGRSVALFDTRAKTGPALQHRVDDATQPLRAIAWDPRTNVVLVGGDDRSVRAVETATGSVIGRWPACTKVGVAGLLPSITATADAAQHWIYVRGADSQLVAGEWGRKRGRGSEAGTGNRTQLRVDSRFVGFAVQGSNENGDTLWGWSAAGTLYMITHADTLLRRSTATEVDEDDGE